MPLQDANRFFFKGKSIASRERTKYYELKIPEVAMVRQNIRQFETSFVSEYPFLSEVATFWWHAKHERDFLVVKQTLSWDTKRGREERPRGIFLMKTNGPI